MNGRTNRESAAALLGAAAFAAALFSAPALSAQESSWILGGTLTEHLYGAAAEASPGADYSYGSSTTLEATLRARGSVLRAEFSAEAALLSGAAARAFAQAEDLVLIPADTFYAPAGWTDPEDVETLLAARVRTAYVKWNADAFALTAGRQVVNYGKGLAWSPVDIFTETDYSGLSLVRRGSDALRLTVPLGTLSLAEAVAAPKADPGRGAYALRLAGLVLDAVDGSLVGAWNGETEYWLAGADAKFDLPWISFHADAAGHVPVDGGAGFLQAVGGFDTSFGDFVLAAEYYYNGGGSAADPYFPGAHNVYAALSWDLADYHALALTGLFDLESGVASLQATWAYDLAQNGSLTAYIKASNGSFSSGGKAWSSLLGVQFEVSF